MPYLCFYLLPTYTDKYIASRKRMFATAQRNFLLEFPMPVHAGSVFVFIGNAKSCVHVFYDKICFTTDQLAN